MQHFTTSMAKKKKLSYLIALLTIFFSCSVSHRKLNNGEGNSVPKEDYVWTNQSKFNSETYNQIDTDYFYELVEEYGKTTNLERLEMLNMKHFGKRSYNSIQMEE
jgi:hypothetical protein